MRTIGSIAIAIGCCGIAHAQYDKGTWLFEVIGGPVSPSNPVVTVNLYAAFPESLTNLPAFGAGNLQLLSDDANSFFFNVQIGSGIQTCAVANLGTPTGSGVKNLSFMQIGVLGCQANPANPIHLWQAQWTTSDFSPRGVYLISSETSHFDIFSDIGQLFPNIKLFPDKFEHGSGVIQVVPVPGALSVLTAGIVLGMPRRRQSRDSVLAT